MTFFQKVKKTFADLWTSMKEHPFITLGIVAAVIIASVLTCGIALLVPTAFTLMAAMGSFFGGLGFAILAGTIISNTCTTGRTRLQRAENATGLGILGGLAAGIGAAALIGLSPIACVVFSGIAFVAGFVGICTMIGNAVRQSCCAPLSIQTLPNEPASQTPTPTNSPNRNRTSYSRFPQGVAPTTHSIAQPDNPTTPATTAEIIPFAATPPNTQPTSLISNKMG